MADIVPSAEAQVIPPTAGGCDGWVGWDLFEPGEKLRLDGEFTADELEEVAALMRRGGPVVLQAL